MKKKLLSIVVALIICISPLFFITGCSGGNNNGVTFPEGLETGWTVPQNGTWHDCVWSGSGEIKYESEEFDANANNGNGGMVKLEEAITVAEAIRQGLLTCIGGLDTSDVGAASEPMILMFDGQTIEVSYTVTSPDGTTEEE